jgi:hypothetical protein
MSLKKRLNRLDAQVDWLGVNGMLRFAEIQMKILEYKRKIAQHLRSHPDHPGARDLAASLGMPVPPLRPPPPPHPEAPRLDPPPEPPRPVTTAPPPAAPPPIVKPPIVKPHVDGPPEHMQFRPVTWRLRGPQDEDDWDDDDDDDYGQLVNEEYDPLEDA